MLRQSIIHVEKDDIGLDEDEEEEEAAAAAQADGGDVDMDNDDGELPELPSSSAPAASSPIKAGRQPTPGTSSINGANGATREPSVAAVLKKQKISITYDKYQMIKSLVVLRLSETERETGEGVARSEIVTWYLEQRENEIQSVEELEQERTLVEKVINKLIKVCENTMYSSKGHFT